MKNVVWDANIAVSAILEASHKVTPQTIRDVLDDTGWSFGELGRQLKIYRREGAFANQPFSRQAVFGYMTEHHPISQPFAMALARLISGHGCVLAVHIVAPDLVGKETIPHGASVRGYCRSCGCGCGLVVVSSVHRYYNDEHRRLARNARRLQRKQERKKGDEDGYATV